MENINLQTVWQNLASSIPGDLESDWCNAENYYSVYQTLSKALAPTSILEIGTRVGHSLIAMASENPSLRRIHWIDNETYVPNSNAIAKANLEAFYHQFHPDWPVPEISFSTEYPGVEDLRGQFELCHIDGDHSYTGKTRDLEYCAALHPTWIIADDFEYHAEVGRAIRHWCSSRSLPPFIVPSYRGLALIPFESPIVEWTLARLDECGLWGSVANEA